jgi:hypothetical protein
MRKNAKITKEKARALARAHGISFSQTFFALSSSKVTYLLELADQMRYKRPANANGSRGRYFFYYLQSKRGE